MSDWHAQKIPHLLHEFRTNLERGLDRDEVVTQRLKHGSMYIDLIPVPSLLLVFLKQIPSVTIILLGAAGVVLMYFQHAVREAIVTFAILAVHVLWRVVQIVKAHHQIRTINRNLELHVSVIRDGAMASIVPNEIVPGDLIVLNAGDLVTADCRIVESESLIVDETRLFGTTISVQKSAEDLSEDDVVPPENQRNMIFAGTHVVEGHGRAIVVRTGKCVELHSKHRYRPTRIDFPSEAEIQIGALYNYWKYGGLIVAAFIVGFAWMFHRTDVPPDWPKLILLGLAVAMASVPEGIASTVRSILAEHAYRLLQIGVVIQGFPTLEKLSNLTALCIDEVGVFTRDELALSHVFVDEQLVERSTWEQWFKELEKSPDSCHDEAVPVPSPQSEVPQGLPLLILAANRCAAGRQYQHGDTVGVHVHDALKQVSERIGFDLQRYESEFPLIDELPETSAHPYRGFVFKTEGEKRLKVIFGEPAAVLRNCRSIQNKGVTHPIKPNQVQLIWQTIQHLKNSKSRVFGIAHASSETLQSEEIDPSTTFLGLVVLTPFNDDQAGETVESCIDAGVKIVMMTDKDRQLATELAKELGITQDKNAVVEKTNLENIGNEDFRSVLNRFLVYCKLSMEQSLAIVQHLKSQEYPVGFFGRSPKDLRAMNAADVSFASAAHAPQVLQRYAGCLILKDGFWVIETLLNHTREAYSNLRSSMRWLLSGVLAQLITLVIGFSLHQLYGFPMPLTLQQIIWIQMLVNLIPSIWLGHDRIRGHLTCNRSQKTPPFFPKSYRFDILLRSLVIGLMTIVSFVVTLEAISGDQERTKAVAQTAACTTLIFTQLISNFQCRRHFWESLAQRIVANPPLLFAMLSCVILHLVVVYVEAANGIFGTMPLMPKEWQWIGSFCILALLPLNLTVGKRQS